MREWITNSQNNKVVFQGAALELLTKQLTERHWTSAELPEARLSVKKAKDGQENQKWQNCLESMMMSWMLARAERHGDPSSNQLCERHYPVMHVRQLSFFLPVNNWPFTLLTF